MLINNQGKFWLLGWFDEGANEGMRNLQNFSVLTLDILSTITTRIRDCMYVSISERQRAEIKGQQLICQRGFSIKING